MTRCDCTDSQCLQCVQRHRWVDGVPVRSMTITARAVGSGYTLERTAFARAVDRVVALATALEASVEESRIEAREPSRRLPAGPKRRVCGGSQQYRVRRP